MAKYGGYIQKIQAEVRQKVNKKLEQDGGIPKGKYQTLVKIVLDGGGAIVDYKVAGTSGNQKIDKAVREALSGIRISDPPPEGMPKALTIRISSQG
jgi:outer membrane biosynthesis protein TonB